MRAAVLICRKDLKARLRDRSALLIGIVTGTYSSIFNASTLLVAWQKASAARAGAPPPGTPRRVARAA